MIKVYLLLFTSLSEVKSLFFNRIISMSLHLKSPFEINQLDNNISDNTIVISKSNENYRINLSTKDDRDEIKELVRLNFDRQGVEPSNELLTYIFPEFYNETKWLSTKSWKITGINDTKILGSIGIQEYNDNMIYISFFYVDSSVRNQGLGKYLWNHCFEWINTTVVRYDKPIYRLIQLVTWSDSFAYSFYIKDGFYEVPLGFIAPNSPTLVRLEKILDK